jgi:hypothetical protein
VTDESDPPSWEPAAQRPRGPLVALLIALAAALLLTVGLIATRSDEPGEAPGPGRSDATASENPEDRAAATREARVQAVQAMLNVRAAALVRDDRAAFRATVDPQSGAFRSRQAAWFANIVAVPLGTWDYNIDVFDAFDLSAERQQVLGPDAFASAVRFSYRVAGYDPVPIEAAQYLTFVLRDGVWLVADDTDGKRMGLHAEPQIWDVGTVNVVRGRYSIVLGLQPPATLRRFATEADRGVPRVTAVWGPAWAGKVVLVVTRTEAEMARLLGGQPSQYTQLAAITRGQIGAVQDSAAADRVVINPKAFGRLSANGRRVILTHEITHVAARAHTQSWTPKWLSEGFADYVGYRGTGIPTLTIAQELAEDVRRGRVPRALPGNSDFTNTNQALPQIYELSWMACDLIAERYGERALVRFYRAVGDDPGGADEAAVLERAFRNVLGTSNREFVADWRAYVKRELS